MRSELGLRWIAVMVSLLSGCAAARQCPPPRLQFPEQLVEIGDQPAENGAPAVQLFVAAQRPWAATCACPVRRWNAWSVYCGCVEGLDGIGLSSAF